MRISANISPKSPAVYVHKTAGVPVAVVGAHVTHCVVDESMIVQVVVEMGIFCDAAFRASAMPQRINFYQFVKYCRRNARGGIKIRSNLGNCAHRPARDRILHPFWKKTRPAKKRICGR